MAEIAVGIDLGTSNTCVSLMRDGKVEVLENAFGERTSASVVHFHDDGSVEVGNSAKAKVIHSPAETVSSAKRLIGRYYFSEEVKKAQAVYAYEIVEATNHSVRIKIREEEFSLPEISAMVLREMKQIAERHVGESVTKAVITVPAYFNDNQRQATKDAGRIAGLEVLRILNEPTAAALAYGFGMGLNQRVAVYDLGGGTFDVSVLEIGKDIFEVLATCGDTFLGGDDFDDRIIDRLADGFVAEHNLNPRNDPYAFEKLKLAAETAKNQLSIDEEAHISIPDVLTTEDGTVLGIEHTITRAEFGVLVHDLIQRTFKVCDEAMQQSDLTVRDLDGVILVGGPTRLPIIRDAVEAYFQQPPRQDVDPDEVVAMGAAIHAASLVGEAQDAMLLDVTPLDLRIGVAGGLAEPVIERNTPVPIEQTRTFTTFQDHQESVKIRVYQGDHRMAEDNALLGEFEFSGFTKGPRADVKIDVTFEIDADGIVNVTASNQITGEAASTQITLSSGLGEEQIEQIIENDVAGRVTTPTTAGPTTTGEEQDTELSPTRSVAAAPEPTSAEESSLFGDGSADLSEGRPDNLQPESSVPATGGSKSAEESYDIIMGAAPESDGLGEVAGEDAGDEIDLDELYDEELIQLTEEAVDQGGNVDDGLFDTSGADLASPEIELTEEEK
jgi:molecular chaperone DnaK